MCVMEYTRSHKLAMHIAELTVRLEKPHDCPLRPFRLTNPHA